MKLLHTRELKVDKKFQPAFKEDGDELYPNGIFEFNITKLLMFIKANPHMFRSEEILVKTARTFPSRNLDESTIKSANIAEPIILAEIAPDRFNVIDGNHRLERAYRDGKRKILACKIRTKQHVVFLTSKAAYEDYVKYWNSKLAEINGGLSVINDNVCENRY